MSTILFLSILYLLSVILTTGTAGSSTFFKEFISLFVLPITLGFSSFLSPIYITPEPK
ncbi:MAG: hypothetical protein RSE41_07135 [Clostridia bacterium]